MDARRLKRAIEVVKATMGPIEKLSALKVWWWAQREVPNMLKRMLGNRWTSAIAIVFVAFVGLCGVDALPAMACEHAGAIEAALIAAGLLSAKDATTGSPPKGAR